PPKKQANAKEPKAPKRSTVQHITRNVGTIPESVHQWPLFPGGGDAFLKYLDGLGREMVAYLPKGMKKAFVQVEFIIDTDGSPVNFKVVRGMNDDDFNDELISRMEKMPVWQPALLNDKPVPKKMVQTVMVEAF